VKNFPHQINELPKLHAGLIVFDRLARVSGDLDDDSLVGVAMARAGVYAFRDKSLALRQALAKERKKDRRSQGTQTFARDLRRSFMLMGFLERAVDGTLRLSALGRHLAAIAPGSPEAREAWKAGLRRVTLLDDEGRESYPYQILLRLISERPGLETTRSALALEARDDSDDEFQRVVRLADIPDWNAVLRSIGASKATARNAAKILPALARQLDELRQDGSGYYIVPPPQDARPQTPIPGGAARPARPVPGLAPHRRRHRQVNRDTIAHAPTARPALPDEEYSADPALTAHLRLQRLDRHNEIVRNLAGLFTAAGYTLREDPYDMFASRVGVPSVLTEVKTLDGTAADEIARVRSALGQVFYYDHFDVPAELRSNGLVRMAIFERQITSAHVAFLEAAEIVIAWQTEEGFFAGPPWSMARLRELGLL
jgi:hypothetical protein